jgi:predicted N-acetyltransferase YhbS
MSCTTDHSAVREACPADASRIAALITQLGYPTTSSEINDRLSYWLPDQMSLVLVAEAGGQVVGCLSVHAVLARADAHAFYQQMAYADGCGQSGRFVNVLS